MNIIYRDYRNYSKNFLIWFQPPQTATLILNWALRNCFVG